VFKPFVLSCSRIIQVGEIEEIHFPVIEGTIENLSNGRSAKV
jgi:hypothetical protein